MFKQMGKWRLGQRLPSSRDRGRGWRDRCGDFCGDWLHDPNRAGKLCSDQLWGNGLPAMWQYLVPAPRLTIRSSESSVLIVAGPIPERTPMGPVSDFEYWALAGGEGYREVRLGAAGIGGGKCPELRGRRACYERKMAGAVSRSAHPRRRGEHCQGEFKKMTAPKWPRSALAVLLAV